MRWCQTAVVINEVKEKKTGKCNENEREEGTLAGWTGKASIVAVILKLRTEYVAGGKHARRG